uniref:NAD(P)H-quinone oxidoreductase subunit 6, chloroplastic n=1 Tax=Cymbomonas tetramitiformis TaxID=36881 RepID=A0A166QJP0_9CHLO|nr:subunit 6 of NADH-plastoquinone oxidoreductase [Cymbomonas tetramitiformis]ANA56944.1 subunit 6 of NADH-plastoquinone oxidoreductase [Cymbomonas tetramitiformis]
MTEFIQTGSFVLLEAICVIGSLGIILLPNLIYSAFLLGAVLLAVAGIYLLLNADFLAAAQILIYVGAINILILFAIMLVNNSSELSIENKQSLKTNNLISYEPKKINNGFLWEDLVKLFLCTNLFIVLANIITSTPWLTPPFVPNTQSVVTIGRHVFSDFLLPFELMSILLLIALIGAVILAKREADYDFN